MAKSSAKNKAVKRKVRKAYGNKGGSGGVYAVILAGGIGSRFWPLSRETTPKQLLKVVGDESLLRSTIKRLDPLIPPERVSIVTNAKQAEIIRLHLSYDGEGLSPEYIIEPAGKNTAPAIGLAALSLYRKDPSAVMVVLPADHLIEDAAVFRETLEAAVASAREGRLVTFGVVPTFPATGYGYIKARPRASKKAGFEALKVERFVEKPGMKRAKRFLSEGGYYWNSGIFVWKAGRILEEMKNHLPGIYLGLKSVMDGGSLADAYDAMESISIDHGVLEKSDDVVVIPARFRWSDIGTWSSFADILDADRDGNIIRGRVVDIGSTGSIIFGCDRLVATIGLRDAIIVDTPDATLVCPKERAQDVKDVVTEIKRRGFPEHELHTTVSRPWGSYTLLERGERYKIKRIRVEPGRRLSLQMHRMRSEHWVVIKGLARVQRGDEVVDVYENQSTYIPRGVKHRLENPGKVPLEIIEVQNGDYVEEDDIVRYDDDFKRD